MNTSLMPALFIGHGSPMNAIADNDWTRAMLALGKRLPKPKAILCISAHWLTEGTYITHAHQPRMIYDMQGFPPELYKVQYPAPGDPFLAKSIHDQFPFIQLDTHEQNQWGLDHGAWSVLKFLFPAADVPVLQLSIDFSCPGSFHLELGKHLAVLRQMGVMIIGSGNIVHNLRAISRKGDDTPFPWAVEFDEWFKQKLLAGDVNALANDYNTTTAGRMSVPTPDHYFPALYVIGAGVPEDHLAFEYEGLQHGSLSMRAFSLGISARATANNS